MSGEVSGTRVVHIRDGVAGAIYIGVCNPREQLAESPFVNPFRVPRDGDRKTVLRLYREHVLAAPRLLSVLPGLRGKALACWCRRAGDTRPGAPSCHGDVLLELLEQHSDAELRAMAWVRDGATEMDALQRSIGEWANTTFPDHTDQSIFKHLLEEVDELTDAYHEWGSQPRSLDEEAADVVILLMTLMHRRGISLGGAIAAKQAINERREWGRGPRVTGDMPDETGLSHHVGHRG
jgi:NTP pyrophosphatase (non-canonical NTP hydrolase)